MAGKALDKNNLGFLGVDFQYKLIGNELQMSKEEARLIYVALTRAKKNLHLQGVFDLIQALKNPNTTIKFK